MPSKRLFWLVSLIGVAAFGPAATLALQPSNEQPAQPPMVRSFQPDAPLSLSFKGGTAGEYIASLRQAVRPRTLNVVFKGAPTPCSFLRSSWRTCLLVLRS